MLKCIFIKRKLYDYFSNSLSEIDKIKVKDHLELCNNCKEALSQIENIIGLTVQKETPRPNDEFWHNFEVGLNERLGKPIPATVSVKRRLSYHLKPAFAYVAVIIFMLVIGGYFYKDRHPPLVHTGQDKYLVDEILALEDVGEEIDLD